MDIYGWFLVIVILISAYVFIRGYIMHLEDKKLDAKTNGRSREEKRQAIQAELIEQMKNKRRRDKEDK